MLNYLVRALQLCIFLLGLILFICVEYCVVFRIAQRVGVFVRIPWLWLAFVGSVSFVRCRPLLLTFSLWYCMFDSVLWYVNDVRPYRRPGICMQRRRTQRWAAQYCHSSVIVRAVVLRCSMLLRIAC